MQGDGFEAAGDFGDVLFAGLVGVHIPEVDELDVIDDDEVGSALAGKLPDGGFDAVDIGVARLDLDMHAGDVGGGGVESVEFLGVGVLLYALDGESGEVGDESGEDLLGRHLEGEDEDVLAGTHGLEGDLEEEDRFAARCFGSDGHEFARLDSTGSDFV